MNNWKHEIIRPKGIPQGFRKVEELSKFLTMVIFTSSAQHAAVHNGQVSIFFMNIIDTKNSFICVFVYITVNYKGSS